MNQLNKTKVHWLGNTLKFGVFLLPFSADFGATALGIVLIGLWRQKYKDIINNPINRVWGLLFIWLVITSLLAVHSRYSWEGLGNFLPSFLMVASFPFLFKDFLRLYQLGWWIVLTSIPVCFLGLMQLFLGWETPLFLHSIGIKMTAYGHPDGRMSSLLMYANTLAFFLVIAFTLSIGLWILHYRRRSFKTPSLTTGFKDALINWQLLILTVAILCNGIALILTNSRSAWGLAILGLMAFAIYLRWYWIIITVLLIIFLVIWAAWIPVYQDVMRQIVPSYFWARLTDEMYDDRYVTALRTTQWGVAWNMMLQRPLWGWGLRNFTPVYQEEMNVWMGHPHNLFLMLLAEIGAIGTLLFSGLVATILGKAVLLMGKIKNNFNNEISQGKENFLLLFTYLVAFSLCIIFNLLDVSIFDLRVNLMGWLLLSAIAGIANYQSLITDDINEISFKK